MPAIMVHPVKMASVGRFIFLSILFAWSSATECRALSDSLTSPSRSKKQTGWDFAGLPVIAYDADQGLQLGALGQLFYYGDGRSYPEYLHTVYVECSWFTRGSAVFQLFYDSKYLIPGGIRLTADLDYLPERALDFYGFNGYEALYNPALINEDSPEYISRVFYKTERKMFRILADLQGPIIGQKLRWLAGFNVIGMKTGTVDIDRINKGKPDDKKLPDTTLLYDRYVSDGIIGLQEKEGGTTLYLKTGLVLDTRDRETAPNQGLWSEILLLAAPTFLGNDPYAFVRLAINHRQYISLIRGHLVGAYQLSYQGTIGGTSPYYILPYMYSSHSLTTKPDGLGGARTLRGILRNRVTGDGVSFGNIELRWKFYKGTILRQHIQLGLNAFIDGGMMVQPHEITMNTIPPEHQTFYFSSRGERLHLSAGLGFRIIVDDNFIIAVDYGRAFDAQDGTDGLYIGVGNIF